jgi:hypothetical protein
MALREPAIKKEKAMRICGRFLLIAGALRIFLRLSFRR